MSQGKYRIHLSNNLAPLGVSRFLLGLQCIGVPWEREVVIYNRCSRYCINHKIDREMDALYFHSKIKTMPWTVNVCWKAKNSWMLKSDSVWWGCHIYRWWYILAYKNICTYNYPNPLKTTQRAMGKALNNLKLYHWKGVKGCQVSSNA